MNLQISEVKDRGAVEERLVLLAIEDCDIGKYFVFITKKSTTGITYTSIKEPFWFPDKQVKKNDLVILYTKSGTNSFKVNNDGTTSHFCYRNLQSPILSEKYYNLIVEANNWQSEKI